VRGTLDWGVLDEKTTHPNTNIERPKWDVADRDRASGLCSVGITGTESHASPFTKWSKTRDWNGDFGVLNGLEQCRSKGIECVKWK
jgi:hypothetical protein